MTRMRRWRFLNSSTVPIIGGQFLVQRLCSYWGSIISLVPWSRVGEKPVKSRRTNQYASDPLTSSVQTWLKEIIRWTCLDVMRLHHALLVVTTESKPKNFKQKQQSATGFLIKLGNLLNKFWNLCLWQMDGKPGGSAHAVQMTPWGETVIHGTFKLFQKLKWKSTSVTIH